MNSKLQKIFLTSTSFIFIFTGRAIASPGPSMVLKGNYWTCPSDNRVLPLDDYKQYDSPGGAAHLRKQETNMARKYGPSQFIPVHSALTNNSSSSLPLVDSDAWIAISKLNIGKYGNINVNSVTKIFLARDIKPQTSYTIKGYDLVRQKRYNTIDEHDRFIFQNADGTELSIVFHTPNSFSYLYHPLANGGKVLYPHQYPMWRGDGLWMRNSIQTFFAMDGRGNKIKINTGHRGAYTLSCNTLDENLTYKSVYPFKMKLKNEYGESYDSPLLVMTLKYIIKPSYIQKAPGFAF